LETFIGLDDQGSWFLPYRIPGLWILILRALLSLHEKVSFRRQHSIVEGSILLPGWKSDIEDLLWFYFSQNKRKLNLFFCQKHDVCEEIPIVSSCGLENVLIWYGFGCR
jgi:hypothetical protein